MPLAFPEEPGHEPEQTGPQPRPGERRPDERDRPRTRTGARDYTGNPADVKTESETTDSDDAPAASQGGEVVIFPGGEVATPPAAWAAAQGWWADARQSATRAVDGSILRARPPAIRDSWVRLQRAEWAGGITALRWAGWIYGAPAQVVRAVLMVVIWLLDHPSRLLV